jgi:hypothetical protein
MKFSVNVMYAQGANMCTSINKVAFYCLDSLISDKDGHIFLFATISRLA